VLSLPQPTKICHPDSRLNPNRLPALLCSLSLLQCRLGSDPGYTQGLFTDFSASQTYSNTMRNLSTEYPTAYSFQHCLILDEIDQCVCVISLYCNEIGSTPTKAFYYLLSSFVKFLCVKLTLFTVPITGVNLHTWHFDGVKAL
jgi:hypothetical protein